MSEHTNHTIIYQDNKPAFVVVPYDEYVALTDSDNVLIPHEVVELQVQYDCNLIGAWRRYKKLTQKEMAQKLEISQAAVSQLEQADNSHSSTLEKAADVLGVTIQQLIDD